MARTADYRADYGVFLGAETALGPISDLEGDAADSGEDLHEELAPGEPSWFVPAQQASRAWHGEGVVPELLERLLGLE
jgi:hypothetical protein